jgi:hypothetical protein
MDTVGIAPTSIALQAIANLPQLSVRETGMTGFEPAMTR